MCPACVIVGQGVAGTLLSWGLRRAGVPHRVIDPGHGGSATRVAAGILNPVTGQRLVKSAGIDAELGPALALYEELGRELGLTLVRRFRLRRLFGSPEERIRVERKGRSGELAPYLTGVDEWGCWIEPAYRVDLPGLVGAYRKLLVADGLLERRRTWPEDPALAGRTVIWCVGAALPRFPGPGLSGLSRAWGDILVLRAEAADPGVILNRGRWALPCEGGVVRVGATFRAGPLTPAVLDGLLADAAALGCPCDREPGVESGVRLTTADRRPLAGWIPGFPGHGVVAGLGSKAALQAPGAARAWVAHLTQGHAFPGVLDPDRPALRRVAVHPV